MNTDVEACLPIDALRASSVLAPLSHVDLAMLAKCGRIQEYASGQPILQADGRDERIFVLCHGRVLLHLGMSTEGGRCGGKAEFELAWPGAAFGWAMWVKPERIAVSAEALEKTVLVSVDLSRLGRSDALRRARQRMILELYARLQEGGVCPPNVQMLLALKQGLFDKALR